MVELRHGMGWGINVLELNRRSETTLRKHMTYLFAKRCFDFASSLVVSAIMLIPLLILCAVVAWEDFGNPFYVQRRVGQNGEVLHMVKLRSMKIGSDNIERTLNAKQLEEYRREYKLADDPRLIGWKKDGDGETCFGAFIRRTSLDELPQILWNILVKGNMSVVGPRPILREELEKNYTPAEQEMLLSVKPGLTGYWQAYARNNATYETGDRQSMELYYVQKQSMWMDMKILMATVSAVLSGSGAK